MLLYGWNVRHMDRFYVIFKLGASSIKKYGKTANVILLTELKGSVSWKVLCISFAHLAFIPLKAKIIAFPFQSLATKQDRRKKVSSPGSICNYNQRRPWCEHILSLCMVFAFKLKQGNQCTKQLDLLGDGQMYSKWIALTYFETTFSPSRYSIISHIFSLPDAVHWLCSLLRVYYDAMQLFQCLFWVC